MSVAFTSARAANDRRWCATRCPKAISEIVAVGGDGTINEAVNGFFDANGPIAPDAVFAFVTSGTGGDFRKTFGIAPGSDAAIARLKDAKPRAHRCRANSPVCRNSGEPVIRYFINIASFGLSGAVVDSVNRARIAKLFGGQFAFAFHSALDMLHLSRPRGAAARGQCAMTRSTRSRRWRSPTGNISAAACGWRPTPARRRDVRRGHHGRRAEKPGASLT